MLGVDKIDTQRAVGPVFPYFIGSTISLHSILGGEFKRGVQTSPFWYRELSSEFQMVNHMNLFSSKLCELNFELVLVKCELAQH